MDKFSDKFVPLEEPFAQQLRDALAPYGEVLPPRKYTLVRMSDSQFGILTKIDVPVGSDSLLLSKEPVLISLTSFNLESSKISVYPDRANFPFEKFPHINYPIGGFPPSICLTREDFREWYAEHTFADLIRLIGQWFKDAAEGNLIKTKDGDFYEPFRVPPTQTVLVMVGDHDDFLENVSYAGYKTYSIEQVGQNVYYAYTHNNLHGTDIGVLLFRSSSNVCNKWFVDMPNTLRGFLEFINKERFCFDTKSLEDVCKNPNCDIRQVFFQLSFIRPQSVIGKKSRVDSLYFKLLWSDYEDKKIEAPITNISCVERYTPKFAQYLSDTSEIIGSKHVLLLGCGAIGSKLLYHLFRSGVCRLTACDNDIMQPHNVCRHALTEWGLLEYKVDLLNKELAKMYRLSSPPIKAVTEDIIDWLPKQNLSTYDLIIDATASASVFGLLNQQSASLQIPIVRFALSDGGKIGLVYINDRRTVALSDYYFFLASLAVKDDNDELREWLKNEAKYTLDRVRIGEGCHSNTMILSDDIISAHTGVASNLIRSIFDKTPQNTAYLSFMDIDYQGQLFTEKYEIPQFASLLAKNKSGWAIRMPLPLLEDIRLKTKIAQQKETGGYLMGTVDIKHKIIYILHQFQPKDSTKKSTSLSLSTKGWKEEYEKVISRTARAIVYVGDWHSHPQGSLEMSQRDMETTSMIGCKEILSDYSLCLITNTHETAAYVFKRQELEHSKNE